MVPPTLGVVSGDITCGDKDYHWAYTRLYAKQDGTPNTRSFCMAKDEKYKTVCKALAGQSYYDSGSISTPDGWKGGYFYYKLN